MRTLREGRSLKFIGTTQYPTTMSSYQEKTLLNKFFKLGLYFALLGEGRLDPMVFELIRTERKLRDAETAATEKPSDQAANDDHNEDAREAA